MDMEWRINRSWPIIASLATLILMPLQPAPSAQPSKSGIIVDSDAATEFSLDETSWSPAVEAWVHPSWPKLADAKWIWTSFLVSPEEAANGSSIITFRRKFTLPPGGNATQGTLEITADNAFEATVNGQVLGHAGTLDAAATDDADFRTINSYSFVARPGENEIRIRAVNYRWPYGGVPSPQDNPGGILFRLTLTEIAQASNILPSIASPPRGIVPRIIPADSIFGANLIFNGNAEAGSASPAGYEVVPVPGWTTTSNFTVGQYGVGGFPKTDDPGPADRGKNLFAGGPNNASSSAVQIIDVSAAADAIQKDEVTFNLAGYLGGWEGQNDSAVLTATYRDVNDKVLGRTVLGPVLADYRNRKSGLWPLNQSGALPLATRKIEFELQMTRTDGNYNDGYADNLEFRLNRLGFLQSLLQQTRLWLIPDQASAPPGQTITVQVMLGYSPDVPVFAEHDVAIDLDAEGADVNPKRVTIHQGSSSATAAIKASQPGLFKLTASAPGLEQTQRNVPFCSDGVVKKLRVDTTRQREKADGTYIPFTVVLEDDAGHPVSDNSNKWRNIAFDPTGVGRLLSSDGLVPNGKCAKNDYIASDEPGVAVIKASVGEVSQEREFIFTFPLWMLVIAIALAIGGGAAGAFVKAGLNWPRSRRWPASRWIVTLSSGALIGLCAFLAYYYGPAGEAPSLLRGAGMGLLLGMVGGYLGRAAMDGIAKRIFPLTKE